MKNLEIEAWRTVGRHLDLGASLDRLAPHVRASMPVSAIAIRRLDVAHACLDAGVTRAFEPEALVLSTTMLDPAAFGEVISFCQAGEPRIAQPDERYSLLRSLLPEGARRPTIYAPLRLAEVPLGVVLLVAEEGQSFTDADLAATRVLLEPLAVAIDNDQRLAELTRLRELAAIIEVAIQGASHKPEPEAAQPALHRIGSLDRALSLHIEDALRATLGRIEGPFGAAARLGVNPHTLRARMRRLGIDWQRFRPASARAS